MARSKIESGPNYFTTFQIAQALGVSAPTVVNWVNAGLLAATRTPGGHRRIRREDVVAFAREYAYAVPPSFLNGPQDDAPRERGARTGARRVLLVDDDADFAAVAEAYLTRKARFEVSTALNGFDAGLAMARERPDVVVLDLFMPGLDGFDVLRRMRADEQTRGVPVIACSGCDAWEGRARRDAFVAYLRKPTPLDTLAAVIREACERG